VAARLHFRLGSGSEELLDLARYSSNRKVLSGDRNRACCHVTGWNARRDASPDFIPDLSSADLSEVKEPRDMKVSGEGYVRFAADWILTLHLHQIPLASAAA
jgi:hypothetical protein